MPDNDIRADAIQRIARAVYLPGDAPAEAVTSHG